MGKKAHSSSNAFADAVIDQLDLSARARRFARAHPQETRLAVAVALETAAVQQAAQDDTTIPVALQPFVDHRAPAFDTVGVKAAAEQLQVSRPTVYDWITRRLLLAWKSTKRGWVIPAEQLLGPGRVVDGLADVLAIIDDPELAWAFLTEPWPFADKVARPLDRLKAGDIDAVLNAAPSFGTAMT